MIQIQNASNNLSKSMPPARETMTQKPSINLLGMSSHILNFLFKISQHPLMNVLINKSSFSKEAHLLL